jgi:biopolymer transport protein ExbD
MSLVATCPQCGSRFAAASQLAGTTVACPSCHAAMQVPLEPTATRKKKRMRWALPVTPPPAPAGLPEYEIGAHDPAEVPAAPPIAGNVTPPHEPAGEPPLAILPKRHSSHEDLVDMTAMVDIVFFLLIFFLVTSLQAIASVIDLPSPKADKGVSARSMEVPDYRNDPSYMVVVIDEGNNVWLDDEIAPGEAALKAMLRSSSLDAQGQRKGLLVIGSADATHEKLVMVLDSAAAVGVSDLLFTVTEDPDAL